MSSPQLRRRVGEVVANRALGNYRQLSVVVPTLPRRARPGQFVIAPPDASDRVLPRTWWIADERTEPGFGSTLDLVLREGGPAGVTLPEAGDSLALTGPLGRGFGLPTTPVTAVVVAQGDAGATGRWLCERLRARGSSAHLLSVAPNPEEHVDLVRARRSADGVVLVEPDSVLEALTALTSSTDAAVLYAVGPVSLSATVAGVAEQAGVVSQVTGVHLGGDDVGTDVCGHGLCGACDLPLAGQREAWLRPCADGPVVRGDLVDWEKVR
ncbi:hypothetical protein NF556_11840 [Ornithinimicrobium faecis]|uniref:Dihydroorotate dehydrogenase electron transfer subunit iron-sulphur cluster binding domain-containing protein n=1 Tax=Ornithinimicrobium faecis TaxID=2934158 RepID=A0ABY4YNP5_9MICO|nr:hypothetical protein [Ornithinimicrobium sp. HY1793]USQ78338.1 hypothetical protein NF556_11840 [Ornithinimicrobium sp. HY1793]